MGSKIQELRDSIERQLVDKSKPWTKFFDRAEAQLNVNRVYLFVGLVVFIGLYLVFGVGPELVCNSIAFIYPAYQSIKALETPQKNDDTKWLTYWVVYACFSLLEYFADTIVGWFPFYWLIKCIFVIWLMLPSDMNGSLIIYNRIIRPNFQKYQGHIDNAASSGILTWFLGPHLHSILGSKSKEDSLLELGTQSQEWDLTNEIWSPMRTAQDTTPVSINETKTPKTQRDRRRQFYEKKEFSKEHKTIERELSPIEEEQLSVENEQLTIEKNKLPKKPKQFVDETQSSDDFEQLIESAQRTRKKQSVQFLDTFKKETPPR